jgi:hypothetical protein
MFDEGSRSRVWRCKNWNSRYAGKEAFTANNGGYKTGRLKKRNYLAHVIIWAIVNCKWPDGDIDHIDGDKSNNKIENLRDVPRSLNARNAPLRKDNTSGRVGVYKHSKNNSWVVMAHNTYIGSYTSFEEAVEAREKVETENGYHKNHGRIT